MNYDRYFTPVLKATDLIDSDFGTDYIAVREIIAASGRKQIILYPVSYTFSYNERGIRVYEDVLVEILRTTNIRVLNVYIKEDGTLGIHQNLKDLNEFVVDQIKYTKKVIISGAKNVVVTDMYKYCMCNQSITAGLYNLDKLKVDNSILRFIKETTIYGENNTPDKISDMCLIIAEYTKRNKEYCVFIGKSDMISVQFNIYTIEKSKISPEGTAEFNDFNVKKLISIDFDDQTELEDIPYPYMELSDKDKTLLIATEAVQFTFDVTDTDEKGQFKPIIENALPKALAKTIGGYSKEAKDYIIEHDIYNLVTQYLDDYTEEAIPPYNANTIELMRKKPIAHTPNKDKVQIVCLGLLKRIKEDDKIFILSDNYTHLYDYVLKMTGYGRNVCYFSFQQCPIQVAWAKEMFWGLPQKNTGLLADFFSKVNLTKESYLIISGLDLFRSRNEWKDIIEYQDDDGIYFGEALQNFKQYKLEHHTWTTPSGEKFTIPEKLRIIVDFNILHYYYFIHHYKEIYQTLPIISEIEKCVGEPYIINNMPEIDIEKDCKDFGIPVEVGKDLLRYEIFLQSRDQCYVMDENEEFLELPDFKLSRALEDENIGFKLSDYTLNYINKRKLLGIFNKVYIDGRISFD